MAFRFFTRKKLFPGITLNMSMSGPSISVGPRGLKHTIGLSGRRTTVGLPGTGLHYSVRHKKNAKSQGKSRSSASSKKTFDPGESSQSFTIEPEVADINTDREFLLGIVAFQNGASLDSLGRLETMNAGDSQWVFGITALLQGKYPQAIKALRAALASNDLGELCARNGLSIEVSIPVTPEVTMHIEPVAFGTRLALAEALQGNGDLGDAFDILKSMNKAMPTELIVVISLAEVAFEIDDEHLISMNELVDILSRATPDTDLAWALKFYMARAKARIGAYMEAINSYDNAMQDSLIPDDMRMLAWYEKALTYGNAGEKTRCRQELSSIYAIDRTYADIEERLSGAKHNDKKRILTHD